jgi:hypothetical protein
MEKEREIKSDIRQLEVNLDRSIELAEKYGLSKLSLEEINKEIKASRKKNKNG